MADSVKIVVSCMKKINDICVAQVYAINCFSSRKTARADNNNVGWLIKNLLVSTHKHSETELSLSYLNESLHIYIKKGEDKTVMTYMDSNNLVFTNYITCTLDKNIYYYFRNEINS